MRKFDRNADEFAPIEDGNFKSVPAGGYIAKITACYDIEDKEYLKIEFDIADGEYKGFFAEQYQRAKFWALRSIRSYKETALRFFNGFITAVEQSNTGYTFDWDAKSLVGKQIGLVLGEEEYWSANNNEIRTRLVVAQVRTIKAIKDGDFKVPTVKPMDDYNKEQAAKYQTEVGTMKQDADTGEVPF